VIVTAAAHTVPLADGISEAECECEGGDANEQSHPKTTHPNRALFPTRAAVISSGTASRNKVPKNEPARILWKIPRKLGVQKSNSDSRHIRMCDGRLRRAWSLFLLPSREATTAAVSSPSLTPPFFRRGEYREVAGAAEEGVNFRRAYHAALNLLLFVRRRLCFSLLRQLAQQPHRQPNRAGSAVLPRDIGPFFM